jgi:MHS family proline/betaine transporter-like MFS transporter
MQETQVFEYLKKENRLAKNPIGVVFKHNLPEVLRTIGLVCMGSTFYYLCFIYMPTFLLQNLKFSMTAASGLMTLCIGSMIILVPLSGFISDHINRRKMLLFNVSFIILFTLPGFYFLLQRQFFLVLFVLSAFTIMSSLEQATTSVAVVENFPTPARYTGLSLGYNIGNAIFGGTAPLVCEWLLTKTHYLYAPAIYIIACAIITGLVVFFSVKDTRGCALV